MIVLNLKHETGDVEPMQTKREKKREQMPKVTRASRPSLPKRQCRTKLVSLSLATLVRSQQ